MLRKTIGLNKSNGNWLTQEELDQILSGKPKKAKSKKKKKTNVYDFKIELDENDNIKFIYPSDSQE